MSDDRVERILDAAYECFTRHGIRRTTMDDIAAAAEMSRPAVYQYVRNKDDAFRRLAGRLFDGGLARATEGASVEGPLADRLYRVLSAKLELTLRLWDDSPHAAELLDAGARLSGDLVEQYEKATRDLIENIVTAAADRGEIRVDVVPVGDFAEIAVAFIHGLETSHGDPELPRQRLRQGVELIVAGLARPT